MTEDRSHAYGRVIGLVEEDAQLDEREKTIIREAADALIFCDAVDHSPDVMEALVRAVDLGQELVDAERWATWRLERLVDDLSECGPGPVPQTAAA